TIRAITAAWVLRRRRVAAVSRHLVPPCLRMVVDFFSPPDAAAEAAWASFSNSAREGVDPFFSCAAVGSESGWEWLVDLPGRGGGFEPFPAPAGGACSRRVLASATWSSRTVEELDAGLGLATSATEVISGISVGVSGWATIRLPG